MKELKLNSLELKTLMGFKKRLLNFVVAIEIIKLSESNHNTPLRCLLNGIKNEVENNLVLHDIEELLKNEVAE